MQRVVHEIVQALDAELQARSERPSVTLLHPPGVSGLPPLTVIETREVAGPRGVLWEQTALAWAARKGLLVNLANTAPILARGHAMMVHDAQTRTHPASYSPAFRLWYSVMQAVACRAARYRLTVSQHSAEALAEAGLGADWQVLHNGAEHILRVTPDENALADLGLEKGRYVLSFAAAQPHKNVALLIDAFSRPALADMDLVLVGARLPDGVSAGRARLLGRVEDPALRALYEGASAFAFPSLSEGFGLPPVEAMHCGCPVVVSKAGALPEVCGDAAIKLPPRDVDAWVDAFVGLRDDAAKREALIAAGQVRAGELTWGATARRLLTIIGHPA
ncbi:MAG: glycosyltransferase family 1 protein [Pseudomonadota bacterium]